MAFDALAFLYALVGGVFMGSYPVPIKCAAVLDIRAHPIVFQCYKSLWAFIVAALVMLIHMFRSGQAWVFQFTWWGVVSAMAWVPSGMCTIAAVPRLGVGLAVVIGTSAASTMSFLVFWLVLGEKMKEYGTPDARYSIAPFYLICVLLGMVALVIAPRLPDYPQSTNSVAQDHIGALSIGMTPIKEVHAIEMDTVVDSDLPVWTVLDARQDGCTLRPSTASPKLLARTIEPDRLLQEKVIAKNEGKILKGQREDGNLIGGTLLALGTGLFSAVQFGMNTVGKRTSQRSVGCEHDVDKCPAALHEQFDAFGSWNVSFGLGALVITSIWLVAISGLGILQGGKAPDLHTRVLAGPGSIAGACWAVGAIFQTAAVAQGGNAVMMPANYAIQLVTSGAWGLLYYREVHGRHRIAMWCVAATWTLTMMVFLSREKATT